VATQAAFLFVLKHFGTAKRATESAAWKRVARWPASEKGHE